MKRIVPHPIVVKKSFTEKSRLKFLSALLAIVFCSLLNIRSFAQTTLSAGDVAFIAMQENSLRADTFAIVLLKNITAGTQISFTDGNWNDANNYITLNNAQSEWMFTWQATSAMPIGSKIKFFANTAGSAAGYTALASTGSIIGGRALSLTIAGDQIFAFQGGTIDTTTNYRITNITRFLAGIHLNVVGGVTNDANWDNAVSVGTSTSELPNDLTTGVNAIRLDSSGVERQNAIFLGPCNSTTLSVLINKANWVATNNPPSPSVCTEAALSNNADLSGLTISSGILNPSFSFGTTSYSASVSNITSLTITPTSSDANSVIAVRINNGSYTSVVSGNQSGSLTINQGTNTIDVRVTAQDGTTVKTYSITVTLSCPTISGTTVVTNVSCNGGSNGAINLTPTGGSAPYTFDWGSGVSTEDRTGLAAGAYSVTITDANGCTGTVNATIIQPSAISLALNSQTNITCFGSSTGSASVIPSGGSSPYTYSWSPIGGTAATASQLPAGSYTVTVTDNNGCTAQRNFTITQPAQSAGSDSYILPSVARTVVQAANNYNYASGSCELVSAVYGSGANPVSGNVSNQVWVESSVPTFAGIPFVQRHYEITPAANAATATGTVTLYFNQAEFDAFNAHPASTLNLPTGPSDAAGKSHLRIGKYSGSSNNGTGLPDSYSSTTVVIDPADTDIVWNATSNIWEVQFTVNGFSGFVVQTVSSTLPVRWASFNAIPYGGQVLLNWSTEAEQHSIHFTVEHSTDGRNWQPAGKVLASGNSAVVRQYRFLHTTPVKGLNYYRITQQDADGSIHYSAVQTLRLTDSKAAVKVLSNPVDGGRLQIHVSGGMQTIRLLNANGKLLLQQTVAAGYHNIRLPVSGSGVYWLYANGEASALFLKN